MSASTRRASIYTAETKNDVTTYLTEGVGEDFWPETFDTKLVDSFEMVSDAEALGMTVGWRMKRASWPVAPPGWQWSVRCGLPRSDPTT